MKQKGNNLRLKNKKTMTQINWYEVVYSDGKRILDHIQASNLTEAKKIAKENAITKNYGTAFYKIARCYNIGERSQNGISYWN